MAEHDRQSTDRDCKVNQIIAAFLEAEKAGNAPAQDEMLCQHPDLAAELQSFFADREQFLQMAEHVAAPADRGKTPNALHDAPTLDPGATAASEGPGETIRYFGDYELLGEIARGGMGVVYRARQVSVNRPVAVKMILAGNLAGEQDVQRFRAEAEAAANLDHPNIVPIYEVGEHEGQHYFSMKLIEGASLAEPRPLGSGGSRSLTVAAQTEAAQLIATVARAVHHAHQRGILHRDLKPGNILIDKEGQPHVTDFGLAKKVEGDAGLTQSGAIIGTPSYMAPEQARGEKGLSTAVDVYGLGVILYELLTGKPPFQAETPLDIVLQLLEREPAAPRSLNPQTNRDLETICLKCLRKVATQRYGSADDLAEDLQRWLDGKPITARRVGHLERFVKWVRRRPTAAALVILAAFTICSLVGVGFWLMQERQSRLEQDLLAQKQAADLDKQKAELKLKSRLVEEGKWFSLYEKARNQRQEGNPWEAMKLLAEAAKIKITPELRREAFTAVNTPAIRLIRDIPIGFYSVKSSRLPFTSRSRLPVEFSPDGNRLLTMGFKRNQERGLFVWPLPAGDPSYLLVTRAGLENFKQKKAKAIFENYHFFLARFQRKKPLVEVIGFRQNPDNHTKLDWVNFLWNPKTASITQDGKTRLGLVSPDGTRYAFYDEVRLGDKGNTVQKIPGNVHAFLSNDVLLFHNPANRTFMRWDIRTAKATETKRKLPPKSELIAVSPGWKAAAWRMPDSDRNDATVQIWDMVSDTLVGTVKEVCLGKRQRLFSIGAMNVPPQLHSRYSKARFSADGRLFAYETPGTPVTIKVWDRTTEKIIRQIAPVASVHGPALGPFSPNGSLLVTFPEEDSQFVELWNLESGQRFARLDNRYPASSRPGRRFGGTDVIWSDDGKRLLTRHDLGVRVWEVAYANSTYLANQPVKHLEFTRDGEDIYVNGVRWQVRPLGESVFLGSTGLNTKDTFLLPRGSRLFAVNQSNLQSEDAIRLQQVQPKSQEWSFPRPRYISFDKMKTPHAGDLCALGISPQGNYMCLVYGTEYRKIHTTPGPTYIEMWNLGGKKPRLVWRDAWRRQVERPYVYSESERYARWPYRIFFSAGETHVAISDDLYTWKYPVKVHRPLGHRLTNANRLIRAQDMSSDLSLIVTGAETGVIFVNRAGDKQRTVKSHKGQVTSLALSPDQRLFASGGDDRVIRIWDAETLKEITKWRTHERAVSALAFSPDGRFLISGSLDGSIKVWNLALIDNEMSAIGLGFAKDNLPWEKPPEHYRYQRKAAPLVENLFAELCIKEEVIQHIKDDKTLAEPVRQAALVQAEVLKEDPDLILFTSFNIVLQPSLPAERYRFAQRLLQRLEDLKLRGHGFQYSTGKQIRYVSATIARGGAHYRLGRYQQALKALRNRGYFNREIDRHAMAFTAMCHHQLGDHSLARKTLGSLRRISLKYHNDDSLRLMREAEKLIEKKPG